MRVGAVPLVASMALVALGGCARITGSNSGGPHRYLEVRTRYPDSEACRSDGPEVYVIRYDADAPLNSVIDLGADGTIDGVRLGTVVWVRLAAQVVRVDFDSGDGDSSARTMFLGTRVLEDDFPWFLPVTGGTRDLVGLMQHGLKNVPEGQTSVTDSGYRATWKVDDEGDLVSWTVRRVGDHEERGAVEWDYTVLDDPGFSDSDVFRFTSRSVEVGSVKAAPVFMAGSLWDRRCRPELTEAGRKAAFDCITQQVGDMTISEWVEGHPPVDPTC